MRDDRSLYLLQLTLNGLVLGPAPRPDRGRLSLIFGVLEIINFAMASS
ncbi:MAG: hypothetical protein WDO24_23960 [Pseudomonadota bacterium]